MAKITSIDIIKGVSVVDTSPFILRSSSVHPPFILRSSSVHPPFILRSGSVRAPFELRSGIEERTENERIINEE